MPPRLDERRSEPTNQINPLSKFATTICSVVGAILGIIAIAKFVAPLVQMPDNVTKNANDHAALRERVRELEFTVRTILERGTDVQREISDQRNSIAQIRTKAENAAVLADEAKSGVQEIKVDMAVKNQAR